MKDDPEGLAELRTSIAAEEFTGGDNRRVRPRRTLNCPARVKALDPLTSIGPPNLAEVIEYSETGIKLRTHRHLIPGTLVQLHVERSFSLWKVRYCLQDGDGYLLGLEMAKGVHPALASHTGTPQ